MVVAGPLASELQCTPSLYLCSLVQVVPVAMLELGAIVALAFQVLRRVLLDPISRSFSVILLLASFSGSWVSTSPMKHSKKNCPIAG